MRRRDFPLFHDELGIPRDEYLYACMAASEAWVHEIADADDLCEYSYAGLVDMLMDRMAERVARPASKGLRAHPSHHYPTRT
mgnify:CR=1 FL=1